MNANQTIINAILKHPLLYKDIDFKHSKEKVLDQLFFTNGNGYEWKDGELVLENDDEALLLTIPENYFETPIFSKEADEGHILKAFRLDMGKEYKPREECNKTPLSIYPICKYAQILNLPENIKRDWLLLAAEAVELGRDYYNDPYKHCTHFYINIWLKERNYTDIKKFVCGQQELLQIAYFKIQKLKEYVI